MTTLQKQLAAIAASSTHELDLKAQKASHAKSLLFEPNVAATQSFDSIYQLCFEGFEELCSLDSRFVPFSKTIFSPQSKNEDRAQMTEKENSDLSEVLQSFLGLVGARLLLKPALKSVEWLVRRFRIQDYNFEVLILTFLPYHNTHLFPTLLSILPKQLSHSFKFLHPYIAGLQNPPRHVIVHAATMNPGFFAALNRYTLSVSRVHHHHTTLLSFWAGVVTQAIDWKLRSSHAGRKIKQHHREEDLLTELLPTLNEALVIKKAPELIIGCYMIITVLVSKTSLEDTALHAFMSAIVQSWTSETVDSGLGCLAIVAERLNSLQLPRLVVRATLRIQGVASKLTTLGYEQPVQNLVVGLATAIIDRLHDDTTQTQLPILMAFLKSDIIQDDEKQALAETCASKFSQLSSAETSDSNAIKELELIVQKIMDQGTRLTEPMLLDKTEETSLISGKVEATPDEIKSKSIQTLRENLPVSVQDDSFLTSGGTRLFADILSKVRHDISDPEFLERLFLLALFQGDHTLQQRKRFSFLAHLCCTRQLSAQTRCTAMRMITESVDSLKNDKDLEVLMPFALVALADGSAKVRREAGSLFMKLSGTTQSLIGTRLDSENSDAAAFSKFYGRAQSQTKSLSAKELMGFINTVICPSIEECISDPNNIYQVLKVSLDADSKYSPNNENRHGKQLTSAEKFSIYSWLCSHVNAMPLIQPKFWLLAILERVGKVKNQPRSKFLMDSLKHWAEAKEDVVQNVVRSNNIDLQKLDAIFLAIAHPSDEDASQYLLSTTLRNDGGKRLEFKRAILQRLRQVWTLLKPSRQQAITESLFEIASTTTTKKRGHDLHEDFVTLLQSVSISPDIFSLLLERTVEQLRPNNQQSATKRRKINNNDSSQDDLHGDEIMPLTKLTFLLELIEGSRLAFHMTLFHGLFHTLNELQGRPLQSAAPGNYPQLVTLTNLLTMAQKLEDQRLGNLDTTIVRPDILVDCVRTTSSPQARNTALLLLAKLAKFMPQTVLHSVIPVFTLMSASTAKQSDELSTHVVDETVREVIPLLVAALRQQNQDLVEATAEIISSFAAVFDHIPSHRRLKLFELLGTSLGAEDCLFAILASLVHRYPANAEVFEFGVILLREFTIFETLTTIHKYINLVVTSFESPALHFQILNQNTGTTQDIAASRSNLLSFVSGVFRDGVLKRRICKVINKNDEEAVEIKTLFGTLVERTIFLSKPTSDYSTIRTQCAEVLETLLTLLPIEHSISSISQLLESADDDLQGSLIRSLEYQIGHGIHQRGDIGSVATALLTKLTWLLDRSDNISVKSSTISCIDKICANFGKTNLTAVMHITEPVASCVKTIAEDNLLQSVALYCLASIVEVLGNDFIPSLQRVMDSAIHCLRTSIDEGRHAERLHNAAYAFFISVLENIPFMLTGDNLATIMKSSYRSAAKGLSTPSNQTRQHFLDLVADKVDIKIVFEVAKSTQGTAVILGIDALHEHIRHVNRAIEICSKAKINNNIRVILEVFMQELEFRRIESGRMDGIDHAEETDLLEGRIIGALISLILKINDTLFRPFFVRFVEWAREDLPKTDHKGKIARLHTLFNFLGIFSERLKSLVTTYFGYVLEPAVEILQQDSAQSPEARVLWSFVLHALTSSFKHDQDDFWQAPSRYNTIMPPLVAQLFSSNYSNNTKSDYTQSYVTPAIVELAATATSPENHKQMNDALLKLLRSDSARVRLSTVKCEEELTKRVGADWLTQLPALLPIISELQEDDDERVEKATARWIKTTEEILGESLNSMLA